MNFSELSARIDNRITVSNLLASEDKKDIVNEVYEGLFQKQKKISSRFFYDKVGSLLFEEITALPEYYPTRTEKAILLENALEIMEITGGADIVELGSGDCSKISILLDSVAKSKMNELCYVPVDVSESAILKSAKILTGKYPDILIHGLLADFMKQLTGFPGKGRKLICFLGSTLGNISRQLAEEFLKNVRALMQPGDRFILGLDMVKDVAILEAAYNDKLGVTEAFNKNILQVINETSETNFNPDLFAHEAFYNPDEARVEMHLRALTDMTVASPLFPGKIEIEKGETIHTENSHKFTNEDINRFATITGMTIENIFSDQQNWFSVVKFKCVD